MLPTDLSKLKHSECSRIKKDLLLSDRRGCRAFERVLCEYKADFFFRELSAMEQLCLHSAFSALDYLAGHASENNTHSARERGRVARESPFAADIAAGGRCLRMLCNASSLPQGNSKEGGGA